MPPSHDSDMTAVAEIVSVDVKAFFDMTKGNSHISDCHVFIRCNPADPFIVNCSQRLVLSTETIWFTLLDELARTDLVRYEAV